MLKVFKRHFIYVVLILSILSCINISSIGRQTAEPIVLLAIAIVVFIGIVVCKTKIAFNFSETAFLLLLAFIMCKSLFANLYSINEVAILLFATCLYFGLKNIMQQSIYLNLAKPLLFSTTIILLVYLLFAVYGCYFLNKDLTNVFIPNKSIFSILLASQIAFALPFYLQFKTETTNFISVSFLIVFIAIIILLVYTQGRAGWLGFAFATLYIFYSYYFNCRAKKSIG